MSFLQQIKAMHGAHRARWTLVPQHPSAVAWCRGGDHPLNSSYQTLDLGVKRQVHPASSRMLLQAVVFPAGPQGPGKSPSPVLVGPHPAGSTSTQPIRCALPGLQTHGTSQKMGSTAAMATAAGQHSWQDRRTLRWCQEFRPSMPTHCPPLEVAGAGFHSL